MSLPPSSKYTATRADIVNDFHDEVTRLRSKHAYQREAQLALDEIEELAVWWMNTPAVVNENRSGGATVAPSSSVDIGDEGRRELHRLYENLLQPARPVYPAAGATPPRDPAVSIDELRAAEKVAQKYRLTVGSGSSSVSEMLTFLNKEISVRLADFQNRAAMAPLTSADMPPRHPLVQQATRFFKSLVRRPLT